jgi:gluconolactonase
VASSGGAGTAGSTQAHGGTPNTGGGSDGKGGVTAGAGGGGGAAGSVVADAGAAGAGPDSGGQGGAGGYPALTADQIGTPVRVAGGYGLAESPLWDPCGHQLLFVDVTGGGTGIIYSVGASGAPSVFMSNTANANGLAWDIDGSLVMAQMGGKHIARRDKMGAVKVIEPPGPALHTPDDLDVRSDGTIYFADGDFCPVGNLLGYQSRLPVYSFKPGATMLANDGVVAGPNGIELSPDEKTLYLNAYAEGAVWPFSVAPDGSLTKAAAPLVTGLSKPDSLCLDAAGNLYVAVTTGLLVLRPDGSRIKLISVVSLGSGCLNPGVTNCTFGGDDGKTLYLTNWTTVYKVEGMPIPGLDWVVGRKRTGCN